MTQGLRVALAYNMKRIEPRAGGVADEEAEYDSPSTIDAIRGAITSLGHDVIGLEADASFARELLAADVDVVFNVAEGAGGRSREAQVPALLELLGVPYTGSDPAAMVLTLDKAVAKAIVRDAGVRTPRSLVVTRGDELFPEGMRYPVVVKPVAEGSSKGVLPTSVVLSEVEARELATAMARRYAQGALVEEYLPGREFTVGILGGTNGTAPTVLPPMEIVLSTRTAFPVYAFDHKLEPTNEVRYEAPARTTPALDRELRDVALAAFEALGCRDVGRVDLRLDHEGRVAFIECNPLPGLTPGWSDLCLAAEPVGLAYPELVGRILAPAIERWAALGRAPRPASSTKSLRPSLAAVAV